MLVDLGEKLRKQLTAMVDEYVRQLPNRIKEIERTFETIGLNPDDLEAYSRLRLMIHKLAGSGATFGFENITRVAKKFENRLNTIIESGVKDVRAAGEELNAALNALRDACAVGNNSAELANLDDQTGQIVQSKSTPAHRDIVIFSRTETAEIIDLRKQLGFFGFSAGYAADLSDFKKTIKANSSQIAIIHTDVIAPKKEIIRSLEAQKRAHADGLKYIFISERSDFATRLNALRAGSDAFFIVPLDIARLMDMIDSLSTTVENEPYHVLIVDDDPEQVSYYALLLQQAGMITSVASDPKTVLNVLVEAKPELILMDMYMPGCSGTELLTLIRQQEAFVSIPVVFLSVENAETKKLAAIKEGGDDFITKPAKPEFLIASISNRVNRTRELRYFMERDSLTGLLNHSNLKEQLIRELLRAERTRSSLCFAMIDLDHFKEVNDNYGHLTGDKVLKSLSRMLQERLRRTDIIGRYGGEEFGVILLNATAEHARQILDEIRENFSQIRHQAEEGEFYATFSCGLAGFPGYPNEGEFTAAADKALYQAKEAGRNQVVVAEP